MKFAYAYYDAGTGKKKLKIALPSGMPKAGGEGKKDEQPVAAYTSTAAMAVPFPVMAMPPSPAEEEGILEEVEQLRRDAIRLPATETEKEPMPSEEDIKITDVKYPLMPDAPKQGERIFAFAHIYFDRRVNELVYDVAEPPLNDESRRMLEQIKDYIQDKLDINFLQVRRSDAENYITDIFGRAVKYFRIKGDTEVLKYYVLRDFIGLEALEPLMHDKNIEDISCDGANIPIYVYHRDPKLGSLRTNIVFTDKDELDSFVNKIAERSGKTLTVAKPLLDGTLPDGSRVQATLGSDIARRGSNLTIRMFTEKPLTPVDMVKFGTMDLGMLAYMWFMVEHGASILISGGTASGKTTVLNVLSLFIKPQMKIISIEDTAELRLPHSHWVPEVARTPIAEEGKVDMFELLRESLRQRPDYIVVGEVRGKEAYVLFQQMAVGHSGMATIHAENFPKLIDRLTTAPISLPANLIQNLDIVLFIKRVKQGRKYNRRVSTILEVLGYDRKRDTPVIENIFKWMPAKDNYSVVEKSPLLRKIANSTGMNDENVRKELEDRAKVLKWMSQKNIRDYRAVSSAINLYYLSPDIMIKRVEAEL